MGEVGDFEVVVAAQIDVAWVQVQVYDVAGVELPDCKEQLPHVVCL